VSFAKFGPHILYSYRGSLGTPRALKVVEPSVAYVRQLRAETHPDTLIIVRWDDPLRLDDPEAGARAWFDQRLPHMRAMTDYGRDDRIVFELGNEPHRNLIAPLTRYTMVLQVLMHDRGLHAGIGSFSVGQPELVDWRVFMPAIQAMAPGDWLCDHDYAKDEADLDNIWHVGRFALAPELAGVPILITEFGSDVTELGGTMGYPGWSDDRKMAFFEKAGAIYDQYDQVYAVLCYTVGQYWDTKWRPFSLDSMWPRMIAAQGTPGWSPPVAEPEPVVWPVEGRISQGFGERPEVYGAGGHRGVDIAPPRGVEHRDWYGTPVRATVAGDAWALGNETEGYGRYVYTFGEREDELVAHLCQTAWFGKRRVEVGDVLGWVGHSGNCEPVGVLGTHVHWGIRPSSPYRWGNGHGGYVDPLEGRT